MGTFVIGTSDYCMFCHELSHCFSMLYHAVLIIPVIYPIWACVVGTSILITLLSFITELCISINAS